MEQIRKHRKKLCLAGAILWMCVIFIFSMHDGETSQEDSNRVGYVVGTIVVEDFKELPKTTQEAYAASISYPIRKTAHMTEYAVLALLLFGWMYDAEVVRERAEDEPKLEIPVFMQTRTTPHELLTLKFQEYLTAKNIRSAERAMGASLLMSAIYAGTDELHQLFVGGRNAQASDVLIDSVGALLALLLVLAVMVLHHRLLKQRIRKME